MITLDILNWVVMHASFFWFIVNLNFLILCLSMTASWEPNLILFVHSKYVHANPNEYQEVYNSCNQECPWENTPTTWGVDCTPEEENQNYCKKENYSKDCINKWIYAVKEC